MLRLGLICDNNKALIDHSINCKKTLGCINYFVADRNSTTDVSLAKLDTTRRTCI